AESAAPAAICCFFDFAGMGTNGLFWRTIPQPACQGYAPARQSTKWCGIRWQAGQITPPPAVSHSSALRKQPPDRIGFRRLYQVMTEPGLQGPLAVFLLTPARERHEDHRFPPLPGANPPRRLPAIEHRHAEIHQDGSRPEILRQPHPFLAVRCDFHL